MYQSKTIELLPPGDHGRWWLRSSTVATRALVLVALHVQSQVVRAGEASAAGYALERLRPGVLPVVSGQLV